MATQPEIDKRVRCIVTQIESGRTNSEIIKKPGFQRRNPELKEILNRFNKSATKCQKVPQNDRILSENDK
jgi:hypothetical protein